MSVIPIPTRRASDILLRERLLTQLQSDQIKLLRIQDQISTGRRIHAPSEDAPAAFRAQTLQSLIEQKDQVRVNVQHTSSHLAASEAAIAEASQLLTNVRGLALSLVNTTTAPEDRVGAVAEIDRVIEQLAIMGNRQYRGRYLFSGSRTDTAPYVSDGEHVVYQGNEQSLRSFADISILTDANYTGQEIFGGISAAIEGTSDLNPALTVDTKLADLRRGAGIREGSIVLSDGDRSTTIDLGSAETVGDVLQLIESNPPTGRTITATLSTQGLVLELDDDGGGSLTVSDVGQGTTAAELGILETLGAGTAPLVGDDLNPRLTKLTRMSDLFAAGTDQTLDVTSGIQISNGGQTFTFTFENAETIEDLLNTLNQSQAGVLAEINSKGTGINIRSRVSGSDFQIAENGGTTAAQLGVLSFSAETFLDELNYGRGVSVQAGPDFVIQRKDGVELDIDLTGAETVQDVLGAINNHPLNLDAAAIKARLSATGNGIELVDTALVGSGTLTVVKEGYGEAAWDLGLVAVGEAESLATAQTDPISGGPAEILRTPDINPLEVSSVFNSLIRLKRAVSDFNPAAVERAVQLLDEDFDRINFARAEMGAQQQSLDAMRLNLEDESVQLKTELSLEIDVDITQAISELAGRQTAVEASLRLMGRTLQLSLLNFL